MCQQLTEQIMVFVECPERIKYIFFVILFVNDSLYLLVNCDALDTFLANILFF